VAFGVAISRMKDFYDIWTLSKQFPFDGASLSAAIAATFERRGTTVQTFERRGTTVPEGVPTALTDGFAGDRVKRTQWGGFLARNALADTALELSGVVPDLRVFLLDPLHAASQKKTFSKAWKPGGPWL